MQVYWSNLSLDTCSVTQNKTKKNNKFFIYLKAVKPPKIPPDAIPTQKPIMNPNFILSKHVGPC